MHYQTGNVLPLSVEWLGMFGNGRQNAFSAVSPPFVRPTAVQHFYADDNDETMLTGTPMRLLMGISNKLSLDLWIMLLFDTDNTMLPRASSRRERVQEKTIAPRSKQPTVKDKALQSASNPEIG